MQSKYFKMKP